MLRSLYEAVLAEVGCDSADGLGHVAFVGFDVNLGTFWGLVWRGDAGEVCTEEANERDVLCRVMDVVTFDLSCTGLLVETLGVALLDDVEGRVDKDLDEAQPGLFVELTGDGAVCAVRRDERCQRDACGVREELRYLFLNTNKRAASESTTDGWA